MTQPLPSADVDPDVEREHDDDEPMRDVEASADDDPLAAAEAANYGRAHAPNPIVEPEPEGE